MKFARHAASFVPRYNSSIRVTKQGGNMPKPFPSLFRGRLVRLTFPRSGDAAELVRWHENDDYARSMDTDYARPVSHQTMSEHLTDPAKSGEILFLVRTLSDDRLIGFVAISMIEWNNQSGMLSMGIGDERDRSQGYGSDALSLILNYAFNELNLFRVGLMVIGSNTRAIRLYEKMGFCHEGAQRLAVHRDGLRCDQIIMGILKDEWERLDCETPSCADPARVESI
jgi:RimJ/RimL family protein N-acetyltransferase